MLKNVIELVVRLNPYLEYVFVLNDGMSAEDSDSLPPNRTVLHLQQVAEMIEHVLTHLYKCSVTVELK